MLVRWQIHYDTDEKATAIDCLATPHLRDCLQAAMGDKKTYMHARTHTRSDGILIKKENVR